MSEPRLSPPERQLSRFMCEELLYEYAEDRLDAERQKAVSLALQSQPELQNEFASIKLAKEYCSQISKTKISTLQIENLKSAKPIYSLIIERLRYRNWPDLLQWTVQAFVLSSLVAGAALIIPWGRIERRLTQPKSIPSAENVIKPPSIPDASLPAISVAATKAVNSTAAITKSKKPATKPVIKPTAKSAIRKAQPQAAAVAAAPKLKGVLYRMWMAIPHANVVGEIIRHKILTLGGHKAGEVRLGWHRTHPRGVYFHFALPKKHYNTIILFLKKYAQVAISKDPSSRIMPKGEVRIILWVQDLTPEAKANDRQEKSSK